MLDLIADNDEVMFGFTSDCVHNVKKLDNTDEDLEDLISIETIGLIKVIESFQTDKGTKLATFATRCIENRNIYVPTVVKEDSEARYLA